MRYSLRIARAATLALLLAACLAVGPRGAAAQDAGSFIANLGTQGLQALGPSVPQAQRIARFRQLFDNDFDIPSISQFVLGPYGRALNPAQHQEFMQLFRDYIVQSYSSRLEPYAGAPFRVVGLRPNGEETVVSSQVVRSTGNPVQIDWHVVNRGGRFLITDVFVEGVSMKVSQRNEFANIIQRNGGKPEALLAVLRQEVGRGYGSSTPR